MSHDPRSLAPDPSRKPARRPAKPRRSPPAPAPTTRPVSHSDLPHSAPRAPHFPWTFTPEGAAVCRDARTAVIADVHLGYDWARGGDGEVVPAHALKETWARLEALLDREGSALERLIVAGDLVESGRPCRETARDVQELHRRLEARSIHLVRLGGNHEGPARGRWPEAIEIAGWTIAHGDRPTPAPRVLMGHHHPVVRLAGITAPCVLAGESRVVLPAFSPNAAGWNVLAGPWPPGLAPADFRCLVCTGEEVLDFGPAEVLRNPG